MNRNACTLYLQSNKENLVKLMKEKGDGVEDLKLGATFVLLTLPLSDPDFEAGGSMLANLTKKALMYWPLLSKATTI